MHSSDFYLPFVVLTDISDRELVASLSREVHLVLCITHKFSVCDSMYSMKKKDCVISVQYSLSNAICWDTHSSSVWISLMAPPHEGFQHPDHLLGSSPAAIRVRWGPQVGAKIVVADHPSCWGAAPQPELCNGGMW